MVKSSHFLYNAHGEIPFKMHMVNDWQISFEMLNKQMMRIPVLKSLVIHGLG